MEILTVYLKATTGEVSKYQQLVRKAKCIAIVLCVWFRNETAGLRRVVFLPQAQNDRYSGLHVALTGDKTSLNYYHVNKYVFECKLFKVEATALQTMKAVLSHPLVDHEKFMWQTAYVNEQYVARKHQSSGTKYHHRVPKNDRRSERKKRKLFYQLFKDENEFNSLNAMLLEKYLDLENHADEMEEMIPKDREAVKISIDPPTDVPRDLPYGELFGKLLMLGNGLDGYFFCKLFYLHLSLQYHSKRKVP